MNSEIGVGDIVLPIKYWLCKFTDMSPPHTSCKKEVMVMSTYNEAGTAGFQEPTLYPP